MKKRKEWVRKALKRKKKEKDRGIVDLMMVMHHFFKELPVWIEEMEDPRHPFLYHIQSVRFILHGTDEKSLRCKNYACHGGTV